MWTKRIKDIIAMLLIVDGALTLIGARNRALVWRFGPEGYASPPAGKLITFC
jgi:hypothetical protein